MNNSTGEGVLSIEEAQNTACEWYGRNRLSQHLWANTVDGYQRCSNCKHVRVKPDGFAEWWNTQGRLFLAGDDIHVQRTVMGISERAWYAAKAEGK